MISTSIVRRMLLGSLLLAGLTLAALPASAQHRARLSQDLNHRLARGEAQIDVIVDGSRTQVEALARQHGLRVKRFLRSGAVLDVTAGQLAAIREDSGVDHLSGDGVVLASADVTRETIGADQVWAGGLAFAQPLNGRGVTVAVIDSGVDVNHESLRGRVLASVDFTGGDGRDGYGHGTHIASLIAGAGGTLPDTAGYGGVAPGARIVSLRVLDDTGAGRMSSVVEAIDWAIEHRSQYHIRIINLSLGGPVLQSYKDDPMGAAAARAVAAGIAVVAAAGNYGQLPDGRDVFGGITSPANHPAVIAVGALDTRGTAIRSDDRIAKFSSRGPTLFDQLVKPDLVAPGRNVVAAESDRSFLAAQSPERHVTGAGRGGYIQLSGSSMSAGLVSGAAALLLDRRPALTPAGLRFTLQVTSSFMPAEGLVASGAGSLNAAAAVRFLGRPTAAGTLTTIAGETVVAGGLATDPGTSALAALFNGAGHAEAGTIMGSKVVWGASSEGDTIIWGSKSAFDTIIWGSSGDTIIWGSSDSDTIIWGSNGGDTIIWGSGGLDTIVWGAARAGTIIWGSHGDDTIVWGSRNDDTIIWGSHSADTIVWGSYGSDTIIWGSRQGDTIVWGARTSETIVWGSSGLDTIVWGATDSDTIIWGSGTDDTIVWGSGLDETIVWGAGGEDTIIWGS